MTRQTRRVMTGHDDRGRAIFLEDGPAPRVVSFGPERGTTFTEIWNTRTTPAPIDAVGGEPEEGGIVLPPPKDGARIRIVDLPPEDEEAETISADAAKALFAEMGAAEASRHGGRETRHAFMHRTESLDYGIVLEGEITLILDVGETVVRAGDIVVQRGTNHGWANRSGKPCRICFVLVDAKFESALRDL